MKDNRKFAVARVVGNDWNVLKKFDSSEKDAAIAYGAEIAKENTEGVITCFLGYLDDNGHMSNERHIYEVWDYRTAEVN